MAELNNSSTGQWSETDASNTSVSPDGWPSGSYFNQVEPIGRATMGAIKRFWDRINGTVTSAGASPAYTYTPANTSFPTAYVTGETFAFIADKTSAGADTLNVNILGAMPLYKSTASGVAAVAAGDIQAGAHIMAQYDAALNNSAGGFFVVGGLRPQFSAAVKSDQTTGTSNVVSVTPGVQQFHASAAKAWANFTVSGSVVTITASYNVSSITYTSVGQYTVNFTTPFSSANYAAVASGRNIGVNTVTYISSQSTGNAVVFTINFNDQNNRDLSFGSIVCYGAQ